MKTNEKAQAGKANLIAKEMRNAKVMSALPIVMLALLTCKSTYADLIITKSGDTITAYNIEIGSKNIFYTLSPDDNASVRIAVNDVFGYKIGDGEMQTVSVQSPKEIDVVEERLSEPVTESSGAAADNSSIISSYSTGDYKFDKKPENKEAKRAIIFYKPTSNSILSNDDIIISLEAGVSINGKEGEWEDAFSLSKQNDRNTRATSQCELRIGITNKTDKNIYIDLSKTLRNGEIPGGYRTFYDGTTTSENGSTSAGIGVSVFGIGAAVGSSSGSSISKTQPFILMIPPHATVYLPQYSYIYDKEIYYEYDKLSYTKKALSTAHKFGNLMQGQTVDFNESVTPSTISYTIAYSFDPEISATRFTSFSLYISRAIGLKSLFNTWSGNFEDRLNRITGLDPKTLVGAVFIK